MSFSVKLLPIVIVNQGKYTDGTRPHDKFWRSTNSREAIRTHLAQIGEAPAIRMIEGLPAFPDEIPNSDWKELRVGLRGGMVTIRRLPGRLSCVIWGNADEGLLEAWKTVIWACARAGAGLIETPSGPVSAEVFAEANALKTA